MREEWPDVPPEHREIWRALDDARPEPLSPAASGRIRRSLAAVTLTLREKRDNVTVPMNVLAAAALVVLVVGGVAGFGVGSLRSAEPDRVGDMAVAEPDTTDQYLLLVHETEAVEQAVREVGMPAIIAEYSEWAGDLARRGRLVSAEKLSETTDWIGTDASPTSPVSGFFLIRAASLEEALAIARESPHAHYGGIVEVRAIDPTGD